MDVVGVQEMNKRKQRDHRRCKKCIKVVYISSPMKVKTCASKFRALVQELTGKNSDADAAAATLRVSSNVNGVHNSPKLADQDTFSALSGVAAMDEQFDNDDLFMPNMEGSLLGMFTSDLFHHDLNFQQDYALKSFDSV